MLIYLYTCLTFGNVLDVVIKYIVELQVQQVKNNVWKRTYFVIAGGTTLYLECVKLPPAKDQEKGGSPTLSVTGNMAKVMEESSKIAYTYSKTLLNEMDPNNEFFQKSSIHLHSPEVSIEVRFLSC